MARVWHDDTRVRHVTMSIAAGTAFLTFYSFAGAPTLRVVPWVHQLFSILVVAAAPCLLVRRRPRTPQAFAEETLAGNIVRHGEWTDVDPPRDLHEAFLIHTVRTRESQRSTASILEGYTHAVRVALADGFVTREEVQQLQALRHPLDIAQADHEGVMAELMEDEHDVRSDPAVEVFAVSGDHLTRVPVPWTPLAHGSSSPMAHRTPPSADHGTPDSP